MKKKLKFMGISLADRRISLRDRIKHFLEKKESVKEAVVKSSGINFLSKIIGYQGNMMSEIHEVWPQNELEILPKVRGVLVDIGCGNGNIIHTAKELGWETWRIDPDPKAVEVAKSTGAKVFQSNLPDTGLPSDYFDVVTLNHVIEHLHDPTASLKEIYRILKPGGMIWVATPNLKSEGLRRFHSNWLHLDSPRHLVLFTPESLKLSCIKAGFSDVSLKPCHVSVYKKSYRMSLNLKPFNNVKAGKLPLKIRIGKDE